MKSILFSFLLLLLVNTSFAQTNYTFTGHGLWSNPANWYNNSIPPNVLPPASAIFIYSSVGDSCILDVDQTISPGASLYLQRIQFVVQSGKNLTVQGKVNLIIPNDSSVVICNQEWKVRNLDVDRYRNGDPIPQVTDVATWASLTTGAWCYYKDDPANGAIYGKLYNWYAVSDPRGLAPEGWHIPTKDEFATLSNCLGGDALSGGALKDTGLTYWKSPNTGATNNSAFTALPGGIREYNASGYYQLLEWGLFWTSTQESIPNAWSGYIFSNNTVFTRDINNKHYGFSVRCVKD